LSCLIFIVQPQIDENKACYQLKQKSPERFQQFFQVDATGCHQAFISSPILPFRQFPAIQWPSFGYPITGSIAFLSLSFFLWADVIFYFVLAIKTLHCRLSCTLLLLYPLLQ